MQSYNYIIWDYSPFLYYSDYFQLRTYSVLFALGLLFVYMKVSKKFLDKNYDIENFLFKLIISTLVFSRIFHCLFYQFEYYSSNLIEILLPVQLSSFTFTGYQGLSSHGGLFGLFLGLFIFQKNKIKLFDRLHILLNILLYSFILMSLIRIGNLFNSEILGKECFEINFLCFIFPSYDMLPRYPVQLLEAFLYFILFVFFRYFSQSGYRDNVVKSIFTMLIALGLVRFFVEFLKLPNTKIVFEYFNMAQLLTLLLLAISFIGYKFFATKSFK